MMSFSIQSEIYQKLATQFENAAKLVKEAIAQDRQIIIRHHADCDGYCAAIALEKVIVPLIIKKHYSDRKLFRYFNKIPNYTPYLNYMDTLKDIGYVENDYSKRAKPLLLVLDTGSTIESLLSYKKYKHYGWEIIVVDHHNTTVEDGKTEIMEYVDLHINSHAVGGDSNISAGMLAFELSQFLLQNKDFILPAVSGIGDKSKGNEFDQYIAKAIGQGNSMEFMESIAEAVDFEAHHIRYGDTKKLVNCFFSSKKETVEANIKIIKEEIQKRIDRIKIRIEKYAEQKEIGKYLFVKLKLEYTSEKDYPADGKTTSLALKMFKEKYPDRKILVLGYWEDGITFRADIEGFDLNEIIRALKKKYPYGKINGGGHNVAGSMRFNSDLLEKIFQYIEEYVK